MQSLSSSSSRRVAGSGLAARHAGSSSGRAALVARAVRASPAGGQRARAVSCAARYGGGGGGGASYGDIVNGTVVSMQPYGVFVDIGNGVNGLLHISQISGERVESVDQVFQAGDEVTALVTRVDNDRGRISLSTRELEASPGDMLRDPSSVYANAEAGAAQFREQTGSRGRGDRGDRGGDRYERAPRQEISVAEGDLVSGVVARLQPYGVFVDIADGARGLLHISQISRERVESVDELFQAGDELKALVVNVDNERGRINLSTKVLEANPGDMLRDPQLVYSQAEAAAERYRQGE